MKNNQIPEIDLERCPKGKIFEIYILSKNACSQNRLLRKIILNDTPEKASYFPDSCGEFSDIAFINEQMLYNDIQDRLEFIRISIQANYHATTTILTGPMRSDTIKYILN